MRTFVCDTWDVRKAESCDKRERGEARSLGFWGFWVEAGTWVMEISSARFEKSPAHDGDVFLFEQQYPRWHVPAPCPLTSNSDFAWSGTQTING